MNVVITGSTQGIGFGLAKKFLLTGHQVLINGRSAEKTAVSAVLLRDEFPGRLILAYACDVSDYTEVERMYQHADRNFGKVDIWINNAGIDQNRAHVWDHDVSAMHRLVDVNIKGVLNGTRAAAEKMKDTGGFVYNMEGFGSNDMMADTMTLYGMTKRALTYFTKSAAREARGTGVKICRLSPGMVLTDFLLASMPEDPGERKRYVKTLNILADTVEDVTSFLVRKMLANRKNGAFIAWLTGPKVMRRFLLAPFRRKRFDL